MGKSTVSIARYSSPTATLSCTCPSNCIVRINADYGGSAGGKVFVLVGTNAWNFTTTKIAEHYSGKITETFTNDNGTIMLNVQTSQGVINEVTVIPI